MVLIGTTENRAWTSAPEVIKRRESHRAADVTPLGVFRVQAEDGRYAQCGQDTRPGPRRRKTLVENTFQYTKHCAPRPTSLCISSHNDFDCNATIDNTYYQRLETASSSSPLQSHLIIPAPGPPRVRDCRSTYLQMPSPSPLYSGATGHPAPNMSLSPFAFEIELNIEFRKTLQARPCSEITGNEEDNVTASCPSHSHHETSCAESNVMSPSNQDDRPTFTASMPGSPTPSSTTSPKGTDTSSNASASPQSTTSIDFTYTPSRSSSPAMPSLSQPTGYHCPKCPESFRLKGELNKHWFRRHQKRFACSVPDCDKAFHLKADLTRHTKSIHEVQAGIPCEYEGCTETFSRKDNMIRHVREEHEMGGRKRTGSR
jgi:hypothetical protein